MSSIPKPCRWRVDQMLRRDELAEAIAEMSAHERDDFPPHWDPLPTERTLEPNLIDVSAIIVSRDSADWVRETYVEKLLRMKELRQGFWPLNDSDDLDRLMDVILALPEGPAIASTHRRAFEGELQYQLEQTANPDRRAKLQRVLDLADNDARIRQVPKSQLQ